MTSFRFKVIVKGLEILRCYSLDGMSFTADDDEQYVGIKGIRKVSEFDGRLLHKIGWHRDDANYGLPGEGWYIQPFSLRGEE